MHEIVPPHLAVKAMQDNGYKNAAYAIAELMDNSIQAGATQVELLCLEEVEQLSERKRSRIKHIAVLDNGHGMIAETLELALQFGNGTHLSPDTQKGIGRFGMGLPASSVSQAQRVEVWTWRNGVESAIHSYLDVDDISRQVLKVIPTPTSKPLPQIWLTVGDSFGESGTLVVWSRLQRCFWKTASAIIRNSEFLIGRIYRKFITNGGVSIRLAAFDIDNPSIADINELALPNDPLYLMERTSCPAPFNEQAMFASWGAPREFTIRYGGADHVVKLTFSHAKKEARESENAGALKHGQHAGKNLGVSIVRADRELDLDETWAIKYDPTERWWGAEIDFPPALDELFGVTNNKQAARNFAELSKVELNDLLRGGKTIHQLQEEWMENDDPRAPLLEIAQVIQTNIKTLRELLKKSQKGKRSQKRHEKTLIEQQATVATKERQEQGHAGASDVGESQPSDKRIDQLASDIAKDLAEGDAPSEDDLVEAKERAARIIDKGLKYEIIQAELETPAFFSVKQVAGVLKVTLNTTHPAYQHLVEVLEKDVEEVAAEQLRERLQNASDGLKLLITAWARYEDEQPDGRRREDAQNVRIDWGRVAKQFFNTTA